MKLEAVRRELAGASERASEVLKPPTATESLLAPVTMADTLASGNGDGEAT